MGVSKEKNDAQKATTEQTAHSFRKRSKLVIDPDRNPLVRKWDSITACCLLFVCFVSPFEVGFITEERSLSDALDPNNLDILFWLNRVVDAVFIIDMVLQFFMMYPISQQYGASMVANHPMIVKHYISTWFAVDFVSVMPFEFAGILMRDDSLSQLKVLRVIRLLRLLKLVRLFRGLRLLKRYELEMGLPYRKITLWTLLITVVLASHWISCLLGIVNNLQGDSVCSGPGSPSDCSETWFSSAAADIRSKGREVTPIRTYCVALYVAATIIVHPHSYPAKNDEERGIFILLIFLGGFLWTRVISKSTAITTSMNRHANDYHSKMDDLNAISGGMGLPREMRRDLRAFFMNTRDSSQRKTWKDLLTTMSPVLRSQVLYHLNKTWLLKVCYLAIMNRLVLQELALALKQYSYALGEAFGENFTLYVMNRGMCTWSRGVLVPKLTFLTAGACWGEEHLLLNNWELLVPNSVTAMSFSEVSCLSRASFRLICDDHPEYNEKLRRMFLWYAMIRTIICEAERKLAEERGKPLHANASYISLASAKHEERMQSKDGGTRSNSKDSASRRIEELQYRAAQAQRNARKSLTGAAMQLPGEHSLASLGSFVTQESVTPGATPAGCGVPVAQIPEGENLSEMVKELLELTRSISTRLTTLDDRTTKLETTQKGCQEEIAQLRRSLSTNLRSNASKTIGGAGCMKLAG